MGQTGTTVLFVVAAAVLCLAAVLLRPGFAGEQVFDDQGELFFPAFTDMEACREVEIRMADRVTGALRAYEMRFDKTGGWRVTTNENYPADMYTSIQRLSAFVGVVKSAIVSDDPSTHSLYGVVDPSNQRGANPADVGRLYTFKDENRRSLADFIIGKPVTRDGSAGMVYARVPGRDRVYEARMDLTMTYPPGTNNWLDADLTDWIDIDPMKFSQQQIMRIRLNRYDVEEQQRGIFGQESVTLVGREVIDLDWNKKDRIWTVKGMDPNTEEVVKSVAEGIASAIDTLTIEGATRKHATLLEWVREGKLAPILPASEMPAPRGTGPNPGERLLWAVGGNGQNTGFLLEEPTKRVFSNLGEVIMELDSGLRYTIRIGEISVAAASGQGETAEAAVAVDTRALRYVMLEVEYDEALMPEPIAPVKPQIMVEEEEREAREREATTHPPAPNGETPGGAAPTGDQEPGADTPATPAIPESPQPGTSPGADRADPPPPVAFDAEREEALRVARNQYSQDLSNYNRDREKWLKDREANQKRCTELQERYLDWVFLMPESLMSKVQKSRADLIRKKAGE